MTDTAAAALSLDNVIDLAAAKAEVGHRVTLAGNINPSETMFLGTPEDVVKDAKRCLQQGYDTKAGYILAMGCGLPIHTPQENVHALLNVARDLGRYPIDPERLS
jgi:uroporphyrinogen decarboxylase